jgi:hypothetical protein
MTHTNSIISNTTRINSKQSHNTSNHR